MNEEGQGLRQAARDNPDDIATHLVYADWLEEYGNPQQQARAEFIRLQASSTSMEIDDPNLRPTLRREKELLKEYGDQWMREDLGDRIYNNLHARKYQKPGHNTDLFYPPKFINGFARNVMITADDIDMIPALVAQGVSVINVSIAISLKDEFMDGGISWPPGNAAIDFSKANSLDIEICDSASIDRLGNTLHLTNLPVLKMGVMGVSDRDLRSLTRPESSLASTYIEFDPRMPRPLTAEQSAILENHNAQVPAANREKAMQYRRQLAQDELSSNMDKETIQPQKDVQQPTPPAQSPPSGAGTGGGFLARWFGRRNSGENQECARY